MKQTLLLLLLLPLACVIANEQDSNKEKKVDDYDAQEVSGKSAVDILKLRGYETEVHYPRTQDGYKIHVVRLINPIIKSVDVELKRPVIFNHGLLECSTIWLINSRDVEPSFDKDICSEEALDLNAIQKRNDSINGPMLLANHGYDVWLMSMRGTDMSRGHVSLKPSNSQFWDYSLDNFALYDIPSVIGYVRRLTGASKVAYVGHSQATFSIFALLSAKPEYANIVEPVFAVAPVAYMHHTNSIARPLFVASLSTPPNNGPFPGEARKIRDDLKKYCSSKLLPLQFICKILDALIGGRGQGSPSGFYSHLPFTSSLKVIRHFGQLITKKKFARYDYGAAENKRRYGTIEAPIYDVGKIRSRSICLFATKTDALSHPADVKLFKSQLRVPLLRDIFIESDFNHFDLITNREARNWVFGYILETLELFERMTGLCSEQKYDKHSNSES